MATVARCRVTVVFQWSFGLHIASGLTDPPLLHLCFWLGAPDCCLFDYIFGWYMFGGLPFRLDVHFIHLENSDAAAQSASLILYPISSPMGCYSVASGFPLAVWPLPGSVVYVIDTSPGLRERLVHWASTLAVCMQAYSRFPLATTNGLYIIFSFGVT